jgi:3-hydroxyisobutyrate dehydrogenase-like beta-hydroxyacid dehydrogenase
MVMGSMLAAYGEGLSLAQASGLDASQLLQVLELGVCGAPLLKLKGAKMLAGDHAPNFPLKHAEKDMRLACELGSKSGITLPVAATADATMKEAMKVGSLADQDFSALFEVQKKAA